MSKLKKKKSHEVEKIGGKKLAAIATYAKKW